MRNPMNSELLQSAKLAVRKPHPAAQIPIFILLFVIIQFVTTIFLAAPFVIWLVNDSTFIYNVSAGHLQAALEVLEHFPDWLTVAMLFVTVVEIVVPILYCRVIIEKRPLRSMGFKKKGWFKDYIVGYLIGTVMIGAVWGLSLLFGGSEVSVEPHIQTGMIILFFFGYLIQGMGEEVLLRGYFMISFANSLKTKHAAMISILVSSALFAVLHLANPGFNLMAFIEIFLCGLFFALYIMRTGQIWGAAAAHSAWNFVQGQVLGISVSGIGGNASIFRTTYTGGEFMNGGAFGLEAGFGSMIIMLIAIVLVLFIPQKKELPQ